MDFNLANDWPSLIPPAATFTFLWLALAKRWLMTGGEHKDRVQDLKDSHARELKQRDEEITHLRETNSTLVEAVQLQSETQKETLQVQDIVKTVMQNLQAQARGTTGPMRKLSQGER